MWNMSHSTLFRSPHWLFSIQCIEMKVGKAGTAHGST